MPASLKSKKNKTSLCGCTICGFISWIGGCDGTRPEHAAHHWFKEQGHHTSYSCFDCFNLYTLHRTAQTKADRGGNSSECSTPDLRKGISTPFTDLPQRRVTSTKTKASFPVTTPARLSLANHDSILQSQAALEHFDVTIPDSLSDTPELSDDDDTTNESQPDYPLTQKEKNREKEKEKEKEKRKRPLEEGELEPTPYKPPEDIYTPRKTSLYQVPDRQKKIKFSKV